MFTQRLQPHWEGGLYCHRSGLWPGERTDRSVPVSVAMGSHCRPQCMGCSGSFEESSETGKQEQWVGVRRWDLESRDYRDAGEASQVLPCELAYEVHSPDRDLGGLKV